MTKMIAASPVGRAELVDNWLEVASQSSDMRVRGNAVIALVTIGGQKRMEMLARLICQTAKEVREGQPGRLEIIGLTWRETRAPRLADADRKLLEGILDSRDDAMPQYERENARAILQGGNLWRQWLAHRRLEPFITLRSVFRTIVLEAVSATLLTGAVLWLIARAIYGVGLPLDDSMATTAFALFLAGLASLSAIVAARLITPGIQSTKGVLFDAGVIAVASSLLPTTLLLLIENNPGGLIGDTMTDWMSFGGSTWWLLAVMALPGFFMLRLLVPLVSGKYNLLSRIQLAGLPLLWATAIAATAIWDEKLAIPDRISSACVAWTVFVVSALTVGAALSSRSARWTESLRMGFPTPLARLSGARLPAFVAACAFVLAVPVANRLVQAERVRSVDLGEDEIKHIPLTMNRPVILIPSSNELKLGLEARPGSHNPQIRIRSKQGVSFSRHTYSPSTNLRGEQPALVRVPGADQVEVCLTDETNCGSSGSVSDWPRLFAGKGVGKDSTADEAAAGAVLIVIPVVSPIKAERLPLGDPQRTRFSGSFTLSPGRNAFEFELPTQLALKAHIAPSREVDAVLILETVSSPIRRWTSLAAQALAEQPLTEKPSIDVTLKEGTYRLCVRLFDYFNLECDGRASELLTGEPIELTVEAPPPEVRPTMPRRIAP